MKPNIDLVHSLLKNKKIEEALENLSKLIEGDVNNFYYHHLKGTIHFNHDDLNNAIKSFSRALIINPNNINMYYLRGISYIGLDKHDEAEKDFKKAIYMNENFSEAYFGLGVLQFEKRENTLAIENFLKSIKFKINYRQPVLELIKTLALTENVNQNDSSIILKHNKLNEIKIQYSSNEYIADVEIKNLLTNIENIIKDNFDHLNFNATQIYRRNHNNLNCKRHKKIFNTYDVIPQFCFSCYKVQVEPENIVDLIKLYIIFDNIKLENNNTRKSMIEVRPNVKGKYKGLVYCNSLKESEIIQKKLDLVLQKNLNKKVDIKIKRGCTEFGVKHPKYDDLKEDALKYNEEWNVYENLIDKKFSHLSTVKENIPTIKGLSLSDALIIKNWVIYAKKNNDNSTNLIT